MHFNTANARGQLPKFLIYDATTEVLAYAYPFGILAGALIRLSPWLVPLDTSELFMDM